jgi:hypothetical protein
MIATEAVTLALLAIELLITWFLLYLKRRIEKTIASIALSAPYPNFAAIEMVFRLGLLKLEKFI